MGQRVRSKSFESKIFIKISKEAQENFNLNDLGQKDRNGSRELKKHRWQNGTVGHEFFTSKKPFLVSKIKVESFYGYFYFKILGIGFDLVSLSLVPENMSGITSGDKDIPWIPTSLVEKITD